MAAVDVSSSVRVNTAPITAITVESADARSFVTVAVTVAVRFGASIALSTAATVAVSEAFVVAPAAITMVASAPTPTV